jgi:hypothetical protein
MGSILRLSQSGIILPGQKPAQALVIDWSHPINYGLTDYLLFGDDGIPNNLASPTVVTTTTSNPATAGTALGSALYCTGGASVGIPDHGNIVAGDFTIRILFMPVTWPNAFTAVFDKGISNNRELSFFSGTTGQINFTNVGGTTSGGFTTNFVLNTVNDLVATRTGTTLTVYASGASVGTATNAGTIPQPGNAMQFGSNPSGGGGAADSKYVLAQIWNRGLTAYEVAQLYLDPFLGLIPQESDMVVLMPVAGLPLMGQIWLA